MSDGTRFSSREHWLWMDDERKIVGCMCGFRADDEDSGHGDSVVDHIADVAAAAVVAERDRLRQAVEAYAIALLDLEASIPSAERAATDGEVAVARSVLIDAIASVRASVKTTAGWIPDAASPALRDGA